MKIAVTEEERSAWLALNQGLCPKCGKPLAVKSDNEDAAEDEDQDFSWFCAGCGVSYSTGGVSYPANFNLQGA